MRALGISRTNAAVFFQKRRVVFINEVLEKTLFVDKKSIFSRFFTNTYQNEYQISVYRTRLPCDRLNISIKLDIQIPLRINANVPYTVCLHLNRDRLSVLICKNVNIRDITRE